MHKIFLAKEWWVSVLVGFLGYFLPLMLWGNDPIDTGWYFYGALAVVASLGFYFYEEWKWLPIGLWIGSMGYVVFTVVALPHSEATAWWQMSVFIMTLGIVPLYLLVGIGYGIRVVWEKNRTGVVAK